MMKPLNTTGLVGLENGCNTYGDVDLPPSRFELRLGLVFEQNGKAKFGMLDTAPNGASSSMITAPSDATNSLKKP
ncbi:hypothetical protein CFIMG_008514RA00001 [Ceratocystis fimbriata CBS 114723]|uniref:Uncharacterized protein n=1 Tax=Ceratocystis fimbriata CBS 114723 TaxID=1035309 RepID=A0A2C5XJX6_9PEZI|nr:hypothetical protein CFIMG_008514RA00001 [Ceratocystis fimbriata CBS 114723]